MEGALRRLVRRCEIHDRSAPHAIRELEDGVGMERSPTGGDFVDQYANPRLIDCGHAWCRTRN